MFIMLSDNSLTMVLHAVREFIQVIFIVIRKTGSNITRKFILSNFNAISELLPNGT